MDEVATIHVPYKKELIESALSKKGYTVQNMKDAGAYYFTLD